MLRSLARSIALSAVAFLVLSVIGLLLVPVLIGTYGLAGFGYVMVARLFLPTAALAFLDFGFGEIATQTTARARADKDWRRAAGLLSRVAAFSVLTGVGAGLVLAALAAWVPAWMNVADAERQGLTQVLRVTGILLPLFFLSLVLEGVIKGFERFAALRAIEVTATLSYAGFAVWAAWGGYDKNAVCFGLLAALVFRAGMAALLSILALREKGFVRSEAGAEDRAWFSSQTRALAANKVLGTAQTQLPPLLVGFMIGPAAVGVYETLNRLPRAVKGVLGLLSSTVLPLATRLESAVDQVGLRRLGYSGVLMVGLISLPPLIASTVFSRSILTLWLDGSALVSYWPWQTALFLIPAASVLVSFGGSALLVRPHVVRTMNRIILGQICIQYLLAILTMGWLQERAFFLGQIVAVGLTFILQMRLIGRELQIGSSLYLSLGKLLTLLLIMVPIGYWMESWVRGWLSLALLAGAWTMASWFLCLWVILESPQRQKLWNVVID